jgi:hypothetical protein
MQEMDWTMLIHANKRYPNSLTANLWQYAGVQAATQPSTIVRQAFKTKAGRAQQKYSPCQKLLVSNPKYWKLFGCPVYVLNNNPQGKQPFHKWKQQSKAGVYIGTLPQHDGRNVALVLDCNTGLVSPQFHVAFEPTFDTITQINNK